MSSNPYDEILKGYSPMSNSVDTPKSPYDDIIQGAAEAHGLDPDLIRATMRQESTFKPNARSPKGASGLMQLMPETAKNLGVKNILDPKENIYGGAKYLKQQLDKFGGDVPKALAAYNAGPGAVVKYGGIPPYKETRDYVKRITGNYKGLGYADPYGAILKDYAPDAPQQGVPQQNVPQQGFLPPRDIPQQPAPVAPVMTPPQAVLPPETTQIEGMAPIESPSAYPTGQVPPQTPAQSVAPQPVAQPVQNIAPQGTQATAPPQKVNKPLHFQTDEGKVSDINYDPITGKPLPTQQLPNGMTRVTFESKPDNVTNKDYFINSIAGNLASQLGASGDDVETVLRKTLRTVKGTPLDQITKNQYYDFQMTPEFAQDVATAKAQRIAQAKQRLEETAVTGGSLDDAEASAAKTLNPDELKQIVNDPELGQRVEEQKKKYNAILNDLGDAPNKDVLAKMMTGYLTSNQAQQEISDRKVESMALANAEKEAGWDEKSKAEKSQEYNQWKQGVLATSGSFTNLFNAKNEIDKKYKDSPFLKLAAKAPLLFGNETVDKENKVRNEYFDYGKSRLSDAEIKSAEKFGEGMKIYLPQEPITQSIVGGAMSAGADMMQLAAGTIRTLTPIFTWAGSDDWAGWLDRASKQTMIAAEKSSPDTDTILGKVAYGGRAVGTGVGQFPGIAGTTVLAGGNPVLGFAIHAALTNTNKPTNEQTSAIISNAVLAVVFEGAPIIESGSESVLGSIAKKLGISGAEKTALESLTPTERAVQIGNAIISKSTRVGTLFGVGAGQSLASNPDDKTKAVENGLMLAVLDLGMSAFGHEPKPDEWAKLDNKILKVPDANNNPRDAMVKVEDGKPVVYDVTGNVPDGVQQAIVAPRKIKTTETILKPIDTEKVTKPADKLSEDFASQPEKGFQMTGGKSDNPAIVSPEENAAKLAKKATENAPETSANSSSESTASQEAINRLESEKNAGLTRVVVDTRSKTERPLIGVDAVDYTPKPYESVEYRGGGRNGEVIAQGDKVSPAYSPPERDVVKTEAKPETKTAEPDVYEINADELAPEKPVEKPIKEGSTVYNASGKEGEPPAEIKKGTVVYSKGDGKGNGIVRGVVESVNGKDLGVAWDNAKVEGDVGETTIDRVTTEAPKAEKPTETTVAEKPIEPQAEPLAKGQRVTYLNREWKVAADPVNGKVTLKDSAGRGKLVSVDKVLPAEGLPDTQIKDILGDEPVTPKNAMAKAEEIVNAEDQRSASQNERNVTANESKGGSEGAIEKPNTPLTESKTDAIPKPSKPIKGESPKPVETGNAKTPVQDLRVGDKVKHVNQYGVSRSGTVEKASDGTLFVREDKTQAQLPLHEEWTLKGKRQLEVNGLKVGDVVTNKKGQLGKVYERAGQLRVKWNKDGTAKSEALSDKWSKSANPEAGSVDPTLLTLGLNKTVSEDVVPALKKTTRAIIEGADDIKKLLFAGHRGDTSRLAGTSLRAETGKAARSALVAQTALKEARSYFSRNPVEDNYDFISKIENGDISSLPSAEQPLAGYIRQLLDESRQRVQALGTGKLENFIENYFPHIWDDPKKATNVFAKAVAKRPFEGSKNFLRQRFYDTFDEGLEAGLKPVSSNPVDLTLLKIKEMDKYVAAHNTINYLKEQGLAQYVKSGEPIPDGFIKIDDKISEIKYTNEKGQLVTAGHLYAAEPAANIINNYLSPGLSGSKLGIVRDLFRGWRFMGNLMNQAQLGLSGFHAMFTTLDAVTSKAALGLNQLASGHPIKGAKSLAELPISPITNFIRGNKVMKEGMRPGTMDADTQNIANWVAEVGGRFKMDDFYQTKAAEKMTDAFKQGNILGGIVRTIPAGLDLASRPLMEGLVPRQKLGVFADLMKWELERLGPDATLEQRREAGARVWDSVDNRMGQLVYDNLFWNKTIKDLSMASVRSVGWNLGDIRELGGAAKDVVTLPLRVKRAMKEGKAVEPIVTYRMAYAAALPFVAGTVGAVTQYLLTGKGPQELKDYFFPRTGNTDENGNPERLSLPTYMKDVYAYGKHPGKTLGHKAHPLIGLTYEMLTNKDYYGTEIRNADDPLVQQLTDVAKHVGKGFMPFSIQGLAKETERQGTTTSKILPFFGFTPAPKDVDNTKAEDMLSDMMAETRSVGSRTKQAAARSREMSDLTRQLKKGVPIFENGMFEKAMKEGLVSSSDKNEILRRQKESYLEYGVKRLELGKALDIYEVATPSEKDRIKDEMATKIRNAKTKNRIDDATQKRIESLGLK